MASISTEKLKSEIHNILKDADLSLMSAKKVRLQLQEKLGCDLLNRKDEIDDIVMDVVNSREDENENSSDDQITEEKLANKRKATSVKNIMKKKKKESESEIEEKSDEEYCPRKTRGGGSAKKKIISDGEIKKTSSKAKGKGKGTGFTRAYKLSPELASFMGAEAMPRHEVVKKMWAVIKERNLLDPKNKQFAICDDEIHKIMGVKKFRTFGMLKYLKSHFLE